MSRLSWNKLVYHLSQSGNSSGYEQTLREKNLQLTELQLYTNNIARSLGIVDIFSAVRKYHQLNTFTSFILSYKSIIYKSSSIWYSINFRSIYSPTFIKPLIFYQFQSINQIIIQQASDILSISGQYTAHHSSSLWSFIPALN